MAKTITRTIDLEPIDRLEEKVRQLVGVLDGLRRDQARLAGENERLTREVETLRGRLAEVEGASEEVSRLREEREAIRARVSEMLEQIERLKL